VRYCKYTGISCLVDLLKGNIVKVSSTFWLALFLIFAHFLAFWISGCTFVVFLIYIFIIIPGQIAIHSKKFVFSFFVRNILITFCKITSSSVKCELLGRWRVLLSVCRECEYDFSC